MPASRRLIIAGVITFVAGLILLFPARVAYQWFSPPGIALSGLDGSIWSGSARDADAGGIYLRDIQWRMLPLQLLTGKLSFAVEGSPAGGFIDTQAAITLGGSLRLTDLRASFALAPLERAANISGLRGIANLQFERIDIEDGVPVLVDGMLEVRDLLLPKVATVSIGGYKAEFFTQEDGIVASVEDTDGTLDLAGRLLIGTDRSYQFLGQIAAKPQTPASALRQMQYLGSANERGQYELRLEGSL